MNIIDFFKDMAASAERTIGGLARDQAANLERRKALDALDARIDQLVADGKIDPAERDEIRAQLTAAGADPAQIEALFYDLDSAQGADDLADKLQGAVRQQRRETDDDHAEQALALNMAMYDYQNGIEAASNIMNNEHKAYMAVIRNIA